MCLFCFWFLFADQIKGIRDLLNETLYFFNRGKMFFVPSLCFALHTTLALRALDDLSIPMYV